MDVARYSFLSQKALHQGLQYAKSLGHQVLEIEHIALALIRAESVSLDPAKSRYVQEALQKTLSELPRVFGNVKINFGVRLDKALDKAESKAKDELIKEDLLWECLIAESQALSNALKTVGPEPNFAEKIQEAEDEASGQDEKLSKSRSKKPNKEPEKKRDEKNSEKTSEKNAEKNDKDSRSHFKLPEKLEKTLNQFTIDLTSMAERGELDPVIGRDAETRRVLEILGRKKKNNPVLIGEAGVGKTAVAEALAIRISEGRVPETLKDKRVLSLDLAGLVAGARFRGEFEERMKNLLEAIQACQGKVVLFIDELHTLVGAGSAEGSADAANLMKPALARGQLRCLGATTLDEYRKHIEQDPALERRFQSVLVLEPDRDTALSILRGIKARYEIHHGVRIHDEALVKAVDLSMRYLTQRRLPDKAIDIVDEACSRLRIQIDSAPSVMDELRAQIEQLEIEKKAIESDKTAKAALAQLEVKLKDVRQEYDGLYKIWKTHQGLLEKLTKIESHKNELVGLFENAKTQGNFTFAAKLQYDEIPKLDKDLLPLQKELSQAQGQYSWLRQEVGGIEIGEVIATWTGIPVDKITKDEFKDLLNLEARISGRVFGQNLAIKTLAHAVQRARMGISDPNRPSGVFLFIGPTGVGKTETVKALAEEIFNDENRMVRIDMSEYMEPHSVSRLVGSPPGYVGYGEGGQLTEPVRRTPFTIVLLDEVEKAHPKVLDILLQTFEDGRLTDGEGRTVDFRNTMIILTSNLPVETDKTPGSQQADDDIRGQLAKMLRPEFVGRIDDIVIFNRLSRIHFEYLLGKLLSQLNLRLVEKKISLVLGPLIQEHLISSALKGQFGGRAMRRSFQSMVTDQLAARLLGLGFQIPGAWQLEFNPQTLEFFWQLDASLDRYLPAAS